MILIVTGEFDPHADHVQALLGDRGTEVVRFNPGDFPGTSEVTVAIDPGCDPRFVLRQPGATREIDLGAVAHRQAHRR